MTSTFGSCSLQGRPRKLQYACRRSAGHMLVVVLAAAVVAAAEVATAPAAVVLVAEVVMAAAAAAVTAAAAPAVAAALGMRSCLFRAGGTARTSAPGADRLPSRRIVSVPNSLAPSVARKTRAFALRTAAAKPTHYVPQQLNPWRQPVCGRLDITALYGSTK